MSGNGNGNHGDGQAIDLQMIYGLLQTMSSRLVTVESKIDRVDKVLSSKADREDLVSLRQTVVGYHASVVGHGIL